MPRPVLFVVDDRPDTLAAVENQLARRYSRDYRVESLGDPARALEALGALADAGEEVALVLVGDALVDRHCDELLERARQLHPDAKRGMIVPPVAWINRPTANAILDAMALGKIEYYVSTPADGRDDVFHQAISSVLLEWATDRRAVPHTVHIVDASWTGRAYELREVFERCAVPHAFWPSDSEVGRELLAKAGPEAKLPLMVLPDGRAMGDPSNAEIARSAGAPADFEEQRYDAVIIGAGPAGLCSAVYAASEGLRTLVIDEGGIGGQARSSSRIRNYLGFPRGVTGGRLAEQAFEQASLLGASFVLMHAVVGLGRNGAGLEVSLSDGRSVGAAVVILATGASYRRLGVPSLEALTGAGVSYGSPGSEAHALSGKDAYIAGGGNSAGQAALHLARYARRVTLVVRGGSLEAGMSHYLVREIAATANLDVRTDTTVVGGGGEGRLQELVLREAGSGDEETVAADALFVMIGARPRTGWLPGEIARDEGGFLLTGDEVGDDQDWPLHRRPFALETSMPGVLAAGDVRHGSVKRVASAVGEGSVAAQLVHGLLADEPLPSAQQRAPQAAAG